MRFALLTLLLAMSASAQPTFADLVVADRPYARIYAPTDGDLTEALEDVSFAAAQFERSFGVAPPKIAVVVADDPATLSTIDGDSLGLRVLPFLTQRAMRQRTTHATVVGGVVVSDVDGALRVAAVLPQTDAPFETGDVVRAVDGEPVSSLAAFRGRTASGPVEVTVERDGAEIAVPFEGSTDAPAATVVTSTGPQMREMLARPLSHEAGHVYLLAYADSGDGYGSALPDWVDEAFATLCERPALVRARDAALRLDEAPIPLDTLFSMRHPLLTSGLTRGLRGDDIEPGPHVHRIRMSGEQADALRQTVQFYTHTSSLARFLAARHGDLVFGRVADRLLGGATTPEALAAEGVDVDELESTWRAWVETTVATR